MKIYSYGKPYTEFKVKEAKYAADYWSRVLLGRRLSDNVCLHLYFQEIEDIGYCAPIDPDNPTGPREFAIILEKALDRDYGLRVLAHEMEHLRQMARKELRNDAWNLWYWKPNEAYYRATDKNHDRLPWEKQAYRSEPYLLQFYDDHARRFQLKF